MLSAKQYPCLRLGKETKSTSGLTRNLNACTKKVFPTAQFQIYHKFYNDKVDTLDGELEDGSQLEDRSQLLDKINYIIKNATDLPTEIIPRDKLLASESLLSLRKD